MYKGIFQNAEQVAIDESKSYWLIKSENGDNYYDLRDNTRPKYVVITEVEPPYLVAGACELGYFSFSRPYCVYFLNEIPADFELGTYCYDGKNFTKFIDVEAWRYNEIDLLKSQIDEIEDHGGDTSHLRRYRIAVRDYSGDGINPPFPTKPQD
ncbi:Uncharacterised protein [Pragia fontium]|uniref:hypothetical protein n=1 Tax=Pragia fontium TaxID=82985 RepID=UPI000DFBFD44|nr:hypothetical protein [Pragia fontium]SUB81755.1 Uncharacterised protein [Pragia fontium]SUC81314.1 Uncharacterised protein [Pragia fontium]